MLGFFSGAKVLRVLTENQGLALQVLEKISTHSGRIFSKNLGFPEPYLFMLMKQNQHTPALYTNKKNVRHEKQSIKYCKWNETKQRLLSLPNK